MLISDWSSDVCSSDLAAVEQDVFLEHHAHLSPEPGGIDVRLKVSIGAVPDTVTGTVLSQATLANLSGADDLLIRGIQSIDLYGDFALGGRNAQGAATLGALTFDTALLNGVAATGATAST